MTRRAGSPPPSSSHHHDRTRTLVSWVPRHIVTPLPSRTTNEISQTTKSSRIKSTREDPSRAPLLVFFPVKPRAHYMVSGRVERVEPDERETVGSLDQHKSDFVGWESSACRLKLHPRISTVCPKRNIIKRRGPRDVIAQTQESKRVEVLTGVGERKP